MTVLDTLYQVLRQLDDINQLDNDELAAQLAKSYTITPPLGYEDLAPSEQAATVVAAITLVMQRLAPKLNPDGLVLVSRITSVTVEIGEDMIELEPGSEPDA